jgi:hypothetical protein
MFRIIFIALTTMTLSSFFFKDTNGMEKQNDLISELQNTSISILWTVLKF